MPERSTATALKQAKVSRRVQIALVRLAGLQSHVAKTVFLGEDGELSPAGERLLGLLAFEAGLNRHGFNADADRRLFDAGAQHIVRSLIDWLDADSAKIARAQQKLKDDLTGREP